MRKRKKDDQKPRELEISADMQGTLTFKDPVHLSITGSFDGYLDTKGYLEIGSQAKVKGDIQGEDITISGRVEGNVFAEKLLKITAGGAVIGDINAKSVCFEEGAFFEGSCQMSSSGAAPKHRQDQMSIEDVADYLNVDSRKVKEWIKDGSIPSENVDNHYIICRSDVDAWIRNQKISVG